MSDCKGSVSPKLDKSCIEGDSEELGEEQASRFRSAVLTLLSQQRKNGHPKHSSIVVYEVEESDSVGDETAEETFEVRQKHRRHVNSV